MKITLLILLGLTMMAFMVQTVEGGNGKNTKYCYENGFKIKEGTIGHQCRCPMGGGECKSIELGGPDLDYRPFRR